MPAINHEAWISASDDILAVLLTDIEEPDEGYFDKAVNEHGLTVQHLPFGYHRSFWNALFQLRQTNQHIDINSIIALAPDVTIALYAKMVSLADSGFDDIIRGRAFDSNVALVRNYGETARFVERLQSSLITVRDGGDLNHEIDALVAFLGVANVESLHDVTAAGGAARLLAYMSQSPEKFASTGIEWLNAVTNGFAPSQLWYLAGPYKSSKTRIGYNMALTLADVQGVSTAILSRENQDRMINAQLVSMLAVKWLLERVPYDKKQPVWWISPISLIRAKNTYQNWQPAVKVEAINYGFKRLAEIGDLLRVYDSTPEGGKLSDIVSIRRMVQRDKRLFDGKVYLLDHLGLIHAEGSVYEKTSANSNQLQALSREDSTNPITLVVLAQLNEDTIKNGEGYNAGVKGGGDPSADADVLLTTHPVEISPGTYYDDRTTLKVKFNRWGSSGDKEVVFFHPGSGLMIDEYPTNPNQRKQEPAVSYNPAHDEDDGEDLSDIPF